MTPLSSCCDSGGEDTVKGLLPCYKPETIVSAATAGVQESRADTLVRKPGGSQATEASNMVCASSLCPSALNAQTLHYNHRAQSEHPCTTVTALDSAESGRASDPAPPNHASKQARVPISCLESLSILET